MSCENKTILYVDMDDTICDFTTHYRRKMLEEPGIEWPQSQYGFFLDLKEIENAIFYMTLLAVHYDIWILTRPSIHNPLCYTEKRVWVEKNMGFNWCSKLILCPDKKMVRPGILVDDKLWPEFQGEQIHFGSQKFPNWLTVFQYLLERLNIEQKHPYEGMIEHYKNK